MVYKKYEIMKYLSIIILSFGLLLSCKKPKDRVEKREDENTVQELVYRNDSLVQATNFTKNGNISYKVKYKKGIISEIKDYYPSGKPKIETKLIWSEDNQNYYIEKAYYTNGKLEYEGEVSIINDKKYRRGWWIFYTKEGKAELMLEFINEGKIEIENQRIVIDVNNQTIKKNKSFYFKNSVVVKNVDSIKVNIKYLTFDTTFDNTLYVVDNEGNELKQVKSKTKGYDWDIKIDSNDPMIKTLLKSKKGKIKTYNYYEIRK